MNRIKHLLCIFWLSLVCYYLIGQSSQYYEETTLRLYNEKKWDSLINLGKEAIKNGLDYFYLQHRIATAYYYKEDYMNAAHHFEKAQEFNQFDKHNNLLLFNSYLFTNQLHKASSFYKKYASSIPTTYEKNLPKFFDFIYLEGGPGFSASKHKNLQPPRNLHYYSGRKPEGSYYFHIGMNIQLTPYLSVYQGYSNIKTTEEAKYLSIQLDTIVQNNPQTNNYYISSKIYLGKNWFLAPAWHYSFTSLKGTKSIVFMPPSPKPFRIKTLGNKENIHEHFFYLNLSKSYRNINLGIFSTYSTKKENISSRSKDIFKTYLGGASLTWFPKGNLKNYWHSEISFIRRDDADTDKQNMLYQIMKGTKLTKKLWCELSGIFGRSDNTVEKNAFVLNNGIDKIDYKLSADFQYIVSKNFELSLRYYYQQMKAENFITKAPDNTLIFRDNLIEKYNKQLIIGGIKWKF